jgi:hypothetical protein
MPFFSLRLQKGYHTNKQQIRRRSHCLASSTRISLPPCCSFSNRHPFLPRVSPLVHQKAAFPQGLQLTAAPTPTQNSSCPRSLLYPSSSCRRARGYRWIKLRDAIYSVVYNSSRSTCHACFLDGHDCAADVRYQHHRFLLLDGIQPSWSF